MKKLTDKGIINPLIILLLIVVIATTLLVYGKIKYKDSGNTNKTQVISTNAVDDKYVTISEWGVRFPKTTVGRFSTEADRQTVGNVQGGPAGMKYKWLDVTGFTKDENTCVLPHIASVINRHLEQNPTMTYTSGEKHDTTYLLNPTTEVKLGRYWYSTHAIDTTSNCFEGVSKPLPNEMTGFSDKYLENFKKIELIQY